MFGIRHLEWVYAGVSGREEAYECSRVATRWIEGICEEQASRIVYFYTSTMACFMNLAIVIL